MADGRTLSVCIVAGDGRLTLGGLAAYQRNLAHCLRDGGTSVTCVSRFDRDLSRPLDYHTGAPGVGREVDGIPTTLIGPAAWARPLLPRLRHMTGRPRFRQLVGKVFGAAYVKSFAAAVPVGVDVVHYVGTGWELLGFAALREARRRGARFTVWPAVHAGTWSDSTLDIHLYSQADVVFCQTDHEAHHLASLGVSRERLVQAWLAPSVPMTGDGRCFRDRHGLGDCPIVLFIARKLRSKGSHVLCEAMKAVVERIPDACLVALGPDGEPPYPRIAAGAYLDLGPADDATKADALAACDVFCLPSAAESFGIVYVETWAYGKPVIGGPAPAVLELVRDDVTGLTVSEQSPAEVTRAIIRLLTDVSLGTRLGQAGQRLQLEKYTWSTATEFHLELFSSLAARRRPISEAQVC